MERLNSTTFFYVFGILVLLLCVVVAALVVVGVFKRQDPQIQICLHQKPGITALYKALDPDPDCGHKPPLYLEFLVSGYWENHVIQVSFLTSELGNKLEKVIVHTIGRKEYGYVVTPEHAEWEMWHKRFQEVRQKVVSTGGK